MGMKDRDFHSIHIVIPFIGSLCDKSSLLKRNNIVLPPGGGCHKILGATGRRLSQNSWARTWPWPAKAPQMAMASIATC